MPIYTSDVKKTGDAEVHHAGTGATINNKFVFVGSGNNGVQARSNIAFTLGETGEAVPTGTDAYVVSLTNGELKLNSGNAVASGKVVTISFWGIAAGLNKDAGKGFTAVSEDTPEDGDNLVVQTAASSDSSFSSPSAVPVKWKKSTTTLDPAAFSDLTVNGTIQGAVGDWARYSGGAQNENADGALKLAAYKITFKTAASNLIRLNSIGGSNGADHKFLYDLKVIIEDHDDETTSKVASRESLTLQIDKDSTSHPSTAKFSFVAGDAATEVANIDESGNLQVDGTIQVDGNVIKASDGGSTITMDTSDNVTIAGDLTVSGNDITFGNGATIVNTDANLLTVTEATVKVVGELKVDNLLATNGLHPRITLSNSGLELNDTADNPRIVLGDATAKIAFHETLEFSNTNFGITFGQGGTITTPDADTLTITEAKVKATGQLYATELFTESTTGYPRLQMTRNDSTIELGDAIGSLQWNATESDGSTAHLMGSIQMEANQNFAYGSAHGSRMKFYTSADGNTASNLALTIEADKTITVAGNIIRASDGGSTITMDTSDNVTIAGDLTVTGNGITFGNGATIVNTSSTVLTITEATTTLSGDLRINGNDIKSSDGNVAITLNSSSATVAGNFSANNLTSDGSITIAANNSIKSTGDISLHMDTDGDAGNNAFIRFKKGTSSGTSAAYIRSDGLLYAAGNIQAAGNLISGGTVEGDLIGNAASATTSQKVSRTENQAGAEVFFAGFTGSSSGTSKDLQACDIPGVVTALSIKPSTGRISAGEFSTASDISFKENIIDMPSVLEDVCMLKPRQFDWKIFEKKNDYGFIAQEFIEKFPQFVGTVNQKDGGTTLALDYSRMSCVLVKAIQELKTENDSLKARVEALESK